MNEIKLADIPVLGFTGSDIPDLGVINTCVHCGLCLPACPTYRITGNELASPRGRIYLMKGVSEGRMSVTDGVFIEQMGLCLNCRACEAACPSGVAYGNILEASRAQVQTFRADARPAPPSPQDLEPHTPTGFSIVPSQKMGFVERQVRNLVFGALFKNLGTFRTFSTLMKVYQKSGLQWMARNLGILKLLGMRDMEAMLPPISKNYTIPSGQTYAAEKPVNRKVALLSGCIMSTAFDHVHQATIRVLQKNGCDVILPREQGCCGALHTHGGDLEGGRDLARRNIVALEPILDELDAIIINAAGCGSTLKEYGHLLQDDAAWHPRAQAFAAKIKDVHEYLAALPDFNTADLKPLPVKVTYQEPCHMVHAQRISAQPRKLLKAIPQLKLIEMFESALCCGSAGIYNVTQPDMAKQLGDRKIENALATKADIIATGNPGCALQLANGLRSRGEHVQVKYIVELLDESYRGSA